MVMSIHYIRATTCLRCFTCIHKGLWLIFLVYNLHSIGIKTVERKDKVKRVEQDMYVKPMFSHASLKYVKPFVLPFLSIWMIVCPSALCMSLSPLLSMSTFSLLCWVLTLVYSEQLHFLGVLALHC